MNRRGTLTRSALGAAVFAADKIGRMGVGVTSSWSAGFPPANRRRR